jgi:hypothetical protein
MFLIGDRDKAVEPRLLIRPPLHPEDLVLRVAGTEQVVIFCNLSMNTCAAGRSVLTW